MNQHQIHKSQHLSVDYDFGEALSYDSAASHMAENNDLDRRMADDEEDEFSDLETPDLPINRRNTNSATDGVSPTNPVKSKRDSRFKIVVSAPAADQCGNGMESMDRAFESRMTVSRAQ